MTKRRPDIPLWDQLSMPVRVSSEDSDEGRSERGVELSENGSRG